MVLGWLWNGPRVILEWSWGVFGVALEFWNDTEAALEWCWRGAGVILG